jgi:hypothetical protein
MGNKESLYTYKGMGGEYGEGKWGGPRKAAGE